MIIGRPREVLPGERRIRDWIISPNEAKENSPQRHKGHKERTKRLCLLCVLSDFVVNRLGRPSTPQTVGRELDPR
jgi:hypothetical protein